MLARKRRGVNNTMEAQTPGSKELRRLAEEVIMSRNTMTIATALENIAWAAPVYYANMGFSFYFFSDPTSRHIQEALKNDQAAASIFCDASTWKEIRGIQMSGSIQPLSPGVESLRALHAYLKKFPFTEEFFDSVQRLDLDAFAKRFKVRFYRFQPTLLYYLDNRIRFSFRERVPL